MKVGKPAKRGTRPESSGWNSALLVFLLIWGALRQNITAPPLGLTHWPVMKVAPGPARKTAAEAISSGRPIRPSGLSDSLASALGDSLPSMGVSIGPGAIALTNMCGANSRAQARVIDRTPPFEAQ